MAGDAELALAMAGLLLESGEVEEADELLVRAYELADELPAERRRRFTVTSTATALYRARLEGDVAEALSAARLALDERWDRSVAVEVRALTLANLGIAEFWAGEFDEALEHLQAAAGLALEFENDFVLFIAESYLSAIDARQGRLEDAHGRARTAIQLAERRGWTRRAARRRSPTWPSRPCTCGGTSRRKPSAPRELGARGARPQPASRCSRRSSPRSERICTACAATR